MKDVVISGRIPVSLMDVLKGFNKSNTQLLNEALALYVKENSTEKDCIQSVYEQKSSDEYQLLRRALDSLPGRCAGSGRGSFK